MSFFSLSLWLKVVLCCCSIICFFPSLTYCFLQLSAFSASCISCTVIFSKIFCCQTREFQTHVLFELSLVISIRPSQGHIISEVSGTEMRYIYTDLKPLTGRLYCNVLYILFEHILKCNSASSLQSSVSHDPSEIILICLSRNIYIYIYIYIYSIYTESIFIYL